MANIVSTASGKFNAGGTWVGGVPPGLGDTFQIANTHVVNDDTAETVLNALGDISRIDAGGELQITNGGDLTLGTLAPAAGSKLKMSATSKLSLHAFNPGGIMEFDIQATTYDNDVAGTSDVEIEGLGSGRFDLENLAHTGTIKGCVFTGAWNGYCFYRAANFGANYSTFTVEDLIFNALTDYAYYSCSLHDIGQWLVKDNTHVNNTGLAKFYKTGTIKVIDATGNYGLYATDLFDACTAIIANSNDGVMSNVYACNLSENASVSVIDTISNTGATFKQVYAFGNSSLSATLLRAAGVKQVFATNCLINTTGNIIIDATNCGGGIYLFHTPDLINFTNLQVILNSQPCYLTYSGWIGQVWTMSRTRTFKIVGASSVSHHSSSGQHYEPIAYDASAAGNLLTHQYDLNPDCPNYNDLYESSGWTASTKTLADGGYLKIKTVGWHFTTTGGRVGMAVALKSLAAAAHANSGTFTENGDQTIRYRISNDGGTTWSAELTLAQLQANSYTIGGNTYILSEHDDIQVEVIYRNDSGGNKTITQVVLSAWEFKPDPPTASGMTQGEQYAAILALLYSMFHKDSNRTGVSADDSLEALRDRGDTAWITGSGLTPQQARNAMKLAPTGGAPASGSVDLHLDAIIAGVATVIAGLLTSQNVRDAMKLAPAGGTPAAGSVDKHLDDIVTAILTQQQVRDAMKLAASTGTPATGSVDKYIKKITRVAADIVLVKNTQSKLFKDFKLLEKRSDHAESDNANGRFDFQGNRPGPDGGKDTDKRTKPGL